MSIMHFEIAPEPECVDCVHDWPENINDPGPVFPDYYVNPDCPRHGTEAQKNGSAYVEWPAAKCACPDCLIPSLPTST